MIKKIFSIYICMLLIVLGFTAIAAANEPPTIPTIDGPTSGKAGVSQSYKFRSTDPEGDDIVYCIEWGCGESECTDPHPSGEEVTASHTYAEGTFIIRAKAIDSNQDESDWATLSITMPRNKEKEDPKPFGFILAFGTSVDVKPPGEDYVDLEILDKTFYIWDQEIITFNPGVFLRLYEAKGLFTPVLPFCIGICSDYGIIG